MWKHLWQVILPAIIYEAEKVNHAWIGEVVSVMMYSCSDKGWITTKLFESWLSDQFLTNSVSADLYW